MIDGKMAVVYSGVPQISQRKKCGWLIKKKTESPHVLSLDSIHLIYYWVRIVLFMAYNAYTGVH